MATMAISGSTWLSNHVGWSRYVISWCRCASYQQRSRIRSLINNAGRNNPKELFTEVLLNVKFFYRAYTGCGEWDHNIKHPLLTGQKLPQQHQVLLILRLLRFAVFSVRSIAYICWNIWFSNVTALFENSQVSA